MSLYTGIPTVKQKPSWKNTCVNCAHYIQDTTCLPCFFNTAETYCEKEMIEFSEIVTKWKEQVSTAKTCSHFNPVN